VVVVVAAAVAVITNATKTNSITHSEALEIKIFSAFLFFCTKSYFFTFYRKSKSKSILTFKNE
jgi:hypothetical protein